MAITATVVMWRSGHLNRTLLAKNEETGDLASSSSQEALYQQSQRNHLQVVTEKARQLEAFFDDVRRAVLLETTLTRSALLNPPAVHTPPTYPAGQVADWVDQDGAFKRDTYRQAAYSIYHLVPGLSQEAARDSLARLAALGEFFVYAEKEISWAGSAYIGTREGAIVGYPGGSRFSAEYDPRVRDWYKKAVAHKHLVWTGPYLDKDGTTWVMTCASPVYAADGTTVLAVTAIDVGVTELLNQLFDLQPLPVKEALLIDDKARARVGASYEGGKTKLLALSEEEAPAAASVLGGRFRPVLEAIQASPDRPAGLVSPGKDQSGDIFTYARVVRKRSTVGTRSWYYVVRTPIEDIVRPAREIKRLLSSFSKDLAGTMESEARSLWFAILIVVQAVVLLALGAAYVAARSTTGPLVEMAGAVEKIGKGDFEQRVRAERSDEIGEVGRAINDMARGLKEGLFVKNTFKRFVAARVVEQLIKEPEKLRLGGERKELTVFFSDLSGFTSMAERLSPEVLVEVVNEYLGAMTDVIFAHEGTLDKYEGDAIMAFWGAPVDQADHALRACRAALDNLTALRLLSVTLQKRGLPMFGLRIGLNTGPMVVGNMGSAVKMDYTVMGDAVNIGSRLEGANKAYGTKILISESTRLAAGAAIETRELDLLAVKGKEQAVRVFELLGLAGSLSPKQAEGRAVFEGALKAYRARRWDEAQAGFQRSLTVLDGDPASLIFLGRIEAFRKQPPPPHWDGSHVMTEK